MRPQQWQHCDTARTAIDGANPFDTTASTDSGFGDPDETLCPDTYLDWDASPDIWFKWSSPGNGSIDVDTCDPPSYDTSIVLYEGLSCDSLVQVACNGDNEPNSSCQNYFSLVQGLTVTSGQTYWVRIGGWQGGTGTGTMHLNFNGESDPTGGCCIGADCVVLTDSQCTAMGGSYLGDDTACLNDPCGSTTVGACCIGGNCTVETESIAILQAASTLEMNPTAADNRAKAVVNTRRFTGMSLAWTCSQLVSRVTQLTST